MGVSKLDDGTCEYLGCTESNADNLDSVILETLNTNFSERQGRIIDNDTSASMEEKKKEGYF